VVDPETSIDIHVLPRPPEPPTTLLENWADHITKALSEVVTATDGPPDSDVYVVLEVFTDPVEVDCFGFLSVIDLAAAPTK
jgi:hypothetical protein